jgi:hypothetical protein
MVSFPTIRKEAKMEYRYRLPDEQWGKLKEYLPGKCGDAGRSAGVKIDFLQESKHI